MTITLCPTLLHLPRAANASIALFFLLKPAQPRPVTVFPPLLKLFCSSSIGHPAILHPASLVGRANSHPQPFCRSAVLDAWSSFLQVPPSIAPPGPSGSPPVASRRLEPTSTTLYSHSHVSHPPPAALSVPALAGHRHLQARRPSSPESSPALRIAAHHRNRARGGSSAAPLSQ